MTLPLISHATGYSTAIADRPTAANAATGRIWYDTGLDMAQVSDGSNWKSEFSRAPFVQTSTAGGDTLSSISAYTSFATTHSVAANSMTVGRVIRVTARGYYSTDGATTPDAALAIVFGSGPTALVKPDITVGMPAGMADEPWEMNGLITFRSIGAGGTVWASGQYIMAVSAGGLTHIEYTGPTRWAAPTTTVSWDTTAAQTLAIQGYFGTSDADNKMTMNQLLIEYLGGS